MSTNLIFLLVGAAVRAAQDTSATIMGVVRDPGDSVVLRANAELRLQDAPRTIFSLRTDDEGKFKFTVLPPGTFTLTVESKRSCRHSGLISSAGL